MEISLGEKVKTLRKKMDMTQAQLAAKIGTAPVTIYKIENNQTNTTIEKILKIAEVLRTTPSYLFETVDFEDKKQSRVYLALKMYEELTPEEKEIFQKASNLY